MRLKISISLFIFSFFSLTVTAQAADNDTGTNPNASDDEVYKVVNACMYLQYDLTPGWVPSNTDKAALYLYNAVKKYGHKRVAKWIIKWVKGLSADHMTLLKEDAIEVINEARMSGMNDVDLSKAFAELLIAEATIRTGDIQQPNKH